MPAVLALLLCAGPAQAFSGRVVSVHDGDTLTVQAEDRAMKVRLADVDAPELRQAYGGPAKASLAELCLGKAAQILVVDHDRYGNRLGRVQCDGVDVNAEQVQRGFAWVYQRRAGNNSPLYFLEDHAQRNRHGLWADRAPAPPWTWRANRRNRR